MFSFVLFPLDPAKVDRKKKKCIRVALKKSIRMHVRLHIAYTFNHYIRQFHSYLLYYTNPISRHFRARYVGLDTSGCFEARQIGCNKMYIHYRDSRHVLFGRSSTRRGKETEKKETGIRFDLWESKWSQTPRPAEGDGVIR